MSEIKEELFSQCFDHFRQSRDLYCDLYTKACERHWNCRLKQSKYFCIIAVILAIIASINLITWLFFNLELPTYVMGMLFGGALINMINTAIMRFIYPREDI